MIAILVRHAERLSSGDDPGLSAAGKRRAALLRTMFADANISAIFTRTFRRTKDTAAPLAQKTGMFVLSGAPSGPASLLQMRYVSV